MHGLFQLSIVSAVIISVTNSRRLRNRREEEMHAAGELTNGAQQEWEFKIMRSWAPIFKRRERLERLCAQEEILGWMFHEKLDNRRVRFKRVKGQWTPPLSVNIDPYRSSCPLEIDDVLGPTCLTAAMFVVGIAAGWSVMVNLP